MRRPIIWEVQICSVCGCAYKWPVGLELPHTRTCGGFECVRKAVQRDIWAHRAVEWAQEKAQEEEVKGA